MDSNIWLLMWNGRAPLLRGDWAWLEDLGTSAPPIFPGNPEHSALSWGFMAAAGTPGGDIQGHISLNVTPISSLCSSLCPLAGPWNSLEDALCLFPNPAWSLSWLWQWKSQNLESDLTHGQGRRGH